MLTHFVETCASKIIKYHQTHVFQRFSNALLSRRFATLVQNYVKNQQPKLSDDPYKREKELYEKNYKSYDAENDISARWKLFEAFPRQVDPIQLDYGTTDTIMTVNVTLTYRNFKVDFNPKEDSVFVPSSVDQRLVNKRWGKAGGALLDDVGLGSIYAK